MGAVVYTPPSLDVSSRISHGLAQEGYALCKYFVMELTFLAIGYATRITEIQEFCMFAFIGLVIDFYMQMFFYAPCLTFDLQRLHSEEKRQFALKLFNTDIPHLHDFVPVKCPMRRIWPQFFEKKRLKKRTLSESQLDDREIQDDYDRKGNSIISRRRCRSNSASNSEWNYNDIQSLRSPVSSNRLRVLYFVTRTRIFQRSIMAVFALWTIWLAFVVHEHGSFPFNASKVGSPNESFPTQAMPPHWQTWSERSYRWWLSLFAELSLSHPGGSITFVPPIVLKTSVGLLHTRSRISWLEKHLDIYLAVMWLILLLCVIGFVLYACFWGRWRTERIRRKEAALASPKSLSPRGSVTELAVSERKSMIESVPIVFSGHRFPVECIAICNLSRLVSCCQQGKVCFWNLETGERLFKLRRIRDVENPSPTSIPVIWCIDTKQSIAVCGCSDGSVEIACLERNKLIGVYHQSNIGAVHVLIAGSKVVVARLDGSIEFLELLLSSERPIRVRSMRLLNTIRAHQKPISFLVASSLTVVSASYDHTLKLFDLRTCQLQSMLHAHSGPVTAVCVDDNDNTLYSACEEGLVCCWSIVSGELLRTLDVKSTGRTHLACTTQFLLGYSPEGDLILWNKKDGTIASRIAQHFIKFESAFASRNLVALNNDLAVTACESTLTFWDLEHKALVRQTFDAGNYFRILCEETDTGRNWSVFATKDLHPVDEYKYACFIGVFLIDHAWTFRPHEARAQLEGLPQLVERMKNLLDIDDPEDECKESDSENEITTDEQERKIVQEKLEASAREKAPLPRLESVDARL
ncbi:WD domain, G-beta repeat protein, partial [Ancylostoma caninum]